MPRVSILNPSACPTRFAHLRGPVYRSHRILLNSQRFSSSDSGENDSGHIAEKKDEAMLFFDYLSPLSLSWLIKRPLKAFIDVDRYFATTLRNKAFNLSVDPKATAEASLQGEPVKIVDIISRLEDGGAFVKISSSGQKLHDLENRLQKHLKENPIRPWFNPFRRVRAFLVRGQPWLADLRVIPSPQIKVVFSPESRGEQTQDLSPETLFSLFRRYGKIANITAQPGDSKEVPRYAIVQFAKTRSAVTAKSCLHGYQAGQVILKLGYQQPLNRHWIWEWAVSHPRITIPLLLALLTTFTVAVFDPIRTFFVKNHITRTFHFSDNKLYKWLSSQASRANAFLIFRRFRPENASFKAIWDDRKPDIESIQTWLMESADTFIVIQGPRGSGKRELVMDQALKGRKQDNLLIDCKAILEARGDSKTIGAAAAEVGYRPVFSWINNVSQLMDLAAQGVIGTKTGFSETLDTQLSKIWQTTGTALRQIALEDRKKTDKDANLGDDEWLEAHPEKRPVVIIDNYLHKAQEDTRIYDKISEWAASLTTKNIAHVIFLTTDVSFSKSLSKALPDHVFRLIALGDTSPEVAKRFVINHIDADFEDDASSEKARPSQARKDLGELDQCISTLGGRLTDLEFLARRIKAGETPNRAVAEIIEQSASEILKMYILDADKSKTWTPEQAWVMIDSLANADSLRYNEILLSDNYKSNGEATLKALEEAELITILSANGRPTSIKPGKPVYSAAFKALAQDHVLKARLDLAILSDLIKQETTAIEKCESELALLGKLPGPPVQVRERVGWLLQKLKTSQSKIEKCESESALLKKILHDEW